MRMRLEACEIEIVGFESLNWNYENEFFFSIKMWKIIRTLNLRNAVLCNNILHKSSRFNKHCNHIFYYPTINNNLSSLKLHKNCPRHVYVLILIKNYLWHRKLINTMWAVIHNRAACVAIPIGGLIRFIARLTSLPLTIAIVISLFVSFIKY